MIGIRGRSNLLPAARFDSMRVPLMAACLCAALAVSIAVQSAVPTDVILVLDNSGSMRENDPDFLAKSAVSKFVSALEQHTRVGIVIFDQNVNYAVPLTELTVASRSAIQRSLDDINYRGQFTDSPAAIERAIYELKSNARDDVAKVIIFMTDGIVDTGKPEVDTEKTKWMREELAADAADSGIKVFAIAFTEEADFFLIQSLAKQTDGAYFRALTPEDLAGVFDKVNAKLEVPTPPPSALPTGVAVPDTFGPCMSGLVPEEQMAFVQMAAEAGIPAEQLCRELQDAPEGTVVVVPPDQQTSEDDLLGLIVVIAAAAIFPLALVALVIFFVRKRRPGALQAAVSAQAPMAIPDAFIKDIHGLTDDPAVQLGEKPLMVGRVAGTDPEHLDYFVVNKGTIGRRHAMIKYRDFSFWLVDQGSVNGTFLNEERIDGERQLKHGDRVKFHKYEFEFSMPEMDDAGHTVFADPSDVEATMIGEVIEQQPPDDDLFDLTGGAEPEEPVADVDEDIFDDDAETALSARQQAELEPDDIDSEAETGVYGAEPHEEHADDEEFMTEGPSASADETPDDEFDAEASAFFGDDSMGPAVGADADIDFDDDDPAPATDPGPVSADNEEDFSESATLQPASMGQIDQLEQSSDISLDEFMRTDSFEAPIAMPDVDDSDDATLLPDQVGQAPAIDDVFDITGEGTIPPVATPQQGDDEADDDAADDDEDSEGPTLFNR